MRSWFVPTAPSRKRQNLRAPDFTDRKSYRGFSAAPTNLRPVCRRPILRWSSFICLRKQKRHPLGCLSAWWARMDTLRRHDFDRFGRCPKSFALLETLATAPTCAVARLRRRPIFRWSSSHVLEQSKKPTFWSVFCFGGRGWIRTIEAEKQQIYSLPPLATRELVHILFSVLSDSFYMIPQRKGNVKPFLKVFSKEFAGRVCIGKGFIV